MRLELSRSGHNTTFCKPSQRITLKCYQLNEFYLNVFAEWRMNWIINDNISIRPRMINCTIMPSQHVFSRRIFVFIFNKLFRRIFINANSWRRLKNSIEYSCFVRYNIVDIWNFLFDLKITSYYPNNIHDNVKCSINIDYMMFETNSNDIIFIILKIIILSITKSL